jgi:NADPH:quinone reductase-like Zn-dependent oxidoreductase
MTEHTAAVLGPAFGLDNLTLQKTPTPTPGPGQALVRVGAVSLNYRDLLMVRGEYNPRQPLPLIPCSDGAGAIVALGDSPSTHAHLRVGQRVTSLFAPGWLSGPPTRSQLQNTLGGPLPGMLSEYALLPTDGLLPTPDHLSDIEAATLPCAALTAWSALVEQARLRPGQTVLILGTGGVALFALRFAQLLGAHAIITSSSDDKLARARALSPTCSTINYTTTPQWGRAARALTPDAEGVDVVIEVGGVNTLPQSIAAVRPGGTICLIGVLSGAASTPPNLTPVLMQNIRIQGVFVGHRDGFTAMNAALRLHPTLRPTIDRAFPLSQATDAFRFLASAQHFGKVCIDLT